MHGKLVIPAHLQKNKLLVKSCRKKALLLYKIYRPRFEDGIYREDIVEEKYKILFSKQAIFIRAKQADDKGRLWGIQFKIKAGDLIRGGWALDDNNEKFNSDLLEDLGIDYEEVKHLL